MPSRVILESGFLPTSTGILYTPTQPNKTGFIKSIQIANNSVSTFDVELYLYNSKTSATSLIIRFTLDSDDTLNITNEYILKFGDSIRGRSNLSSVYYTINGYENYSLDA